MICNRCKLVASTNRKLFNAGKYPPGGWIQHPDCGCACMHKAPTQWEDMFSVKEPYEEDSTDQD